jgi:phosphonatase-like hydrolase
MKLKNIKMVVFDLSGTTVEDDNAVAKSLHQAAIEYGLQLPLSEFEKTIGTNKIHLYQYLIAKNLGRDISFEDFERKSFPDLHEEAMKIFERYSVIMLNYYKEHVKAMSGTEDVFMWCRQQNIKVVTDTGFHRDINNAIMEGLGWLKNEMIDLSVDVETTGGVGRPAPYMIFHAMRQLGIQSVHEVVKIGDTPADLLSGFNAGCIGNIGVLSGANTKETLSKYPHTHILNSINELPGLLT